MPKRPDTLETTVLAIELLRRIPRHRKVSAPELHAQLSSAGIERDLRTVQRQLDMLSRHFDIERDDSSKPYGYRWREQSPGLSVPGLTPQQSLLLSLAEAHLSSLLPARLVRSMQGFFEQARRDLMHTEGAALEREWLRKVRVVATSQPLLPPTIRADVFEAVSNALYANHWLRLDYRNAAGKRSPVEVMPLGIAQQGPRLYLVCRYRGFDNERSLALHRMRAAEMLPHTFERPRGFGGPQPRAGYAAELDGAPGRFGQPRQRGEQRGLAGAVGTEDAEHLARREHEIEGVDQGSRAGAEGELAGGQVHACRLRAGAAATASPAPRSAR